MTCGKFVSILLKFRRGEITFSEYDRAYKEALKDNQQCNGRCENPYGCNGGCYEY